MKICVINPNTSATMTAVAAPDTRVEAVKPSFGAASGAGVRLERTIDEASSGKETRNAADLPGAERWQEPNKEFADDRIAHL